MAWNYANYIDAVANAGKQEYRIPMYVNAQLPAALESAGKYPSGGPHPYYLEVWREAAPSIDFYSPDIYWPDFAYWMKRYEFPGNAIFVPEARMDVAAFNAMYAYGEGRAFGFSPFAIDALKAADSPAPIIMQVYELLESMGICCRRHRRKRKRGLWFSIRPVREGCRRWPSADICLRQRFRDCGR